MTSRRRKVATARSGTEWAARAGLAALLATMGVVSVRQSIAAAVRRADPVWAATLAPNDGQALALSAQRLVSPESGRAEWADADRLSRSALRRDPTAVAAAATLGFVAQVRKDTPRARTIFGYAQSLSRRDLRTQIWAIEDAVGRGDVKEALRHYDIALRTSRQAPDILFPILASAVGDRDVRSELATTMALKPRWNETFIPYVAGNGSDPMAVADLFASLARASVDIPPPSQAMVVARLLAAQKPDGAWRYYTTLRSGTRRDRSRDPRFTDPVTEPTPFDWTPSSGGTMSVAIQRSPGGGSVDFSAPPGDGGVLLSQMQLLPPGRYVLQGRSADIDQPPAARPYWMLSCASGRELGRVEVSNSPRAEATFQGLFVVPTDCPVQRLALIAKPSEAVTGSSGRVIMAMLRPAGGKR